MQSRFIPSHCSGCVRARYLCLKFPLRGWCPDTVTVRGEYKTSKLAFLPGVLACITPLTASLPLARNVFFIDVHACALHSPVCTV